MRLTTGIIQKGTGRQGAASRMYRLLNTESILRDTITVWPESGRPQSAVPGVEQAVDAIDVVHQLLTWTTDGTNGAALGRIRSSPAYDAAIVDLEQPVVTLRGHLNAVDRADDPAGLQDGLSSATATVLAGLGQVLDVVRGGLTTLPVKGQLAALKQVQDFRQQATNLALTNEAVTGDRHGPEYGSATPDGAAVIGDELAAVAEIELRSARRWRCTSITIMILISGIAAGILFGTPLAAGNLHGDLARLSITVPLAALATYLGRESSRHRDRGERAQDLGLHLRHLRTFSKPLGTDDGRRYRFELGQRAWPPQDPPQAADPVAGVAEELARLTEVLRLRAEGRDEPRDQEAS
jgi:hypothetical protein